VLNNSNKITGAIAKTFIVHTVAVQLRKEIQAAKLNHAIFSFFVS